MEPILSRYIPVCEEGPENEIDRVHRRCFEVKDNKRHVGSVGSSVGSSVGNIGVMRQIAVAYLQIRWNHRPSVCYHLHLDSHSREAEAVSQHRSFWWLPRWFIADVSSLCYECGFSRTDSSKGCFKPCGAPTGFRFRLVSTLAECLKKSDRLIWKALDDSKRLRRYINPLAT